MLRWGPRKRAAEAAQNSLRGTSEAQGPPLQLTGRHSTARLRACASPHGSSPRRLSTALSPLAGRGPGLGLAAAHGAALPGPGLGAGGAHGTHGGPGRLDDGHLGPARLFRPELLLGLGPVPRGATLGLPLTFPDRVGPGAHLVLPFLVHALPLLGCLLGLLFGDLRPIPGARARRSASLARPFRDRRERQVQAAGETCRP